MCRILCKNELAKGAGVGSRANPAYTGGHTGPSDLTSPFSACATPVRGHEQTGAGTAWAPCVNAEQIHREKASELFTVCLRNCALVPHIIGLFSQYYTSCRESHEDSEECKLKYVNPFKSGFNLVIRFTLCNNLNANLCRLAEIEKNSFIF